jgi:hypothetical protein
LKAEGAISLMGSLLIEMGHDPLLIVRRNGDWSTRIGIRTPLQKCDRAEIMVCLKSLVLKCARNHVGGCQCVSSDSKKAYFIREKLMFAMTQHHAMLSYIVGYGLHGMKSQDGEACPGYGVRVRAA